MKPSIALWIAVFSMLVLIHSASRRRGARDAPGHAPERDRRRGHMGHERRAGDPSHDLRRCNAPHAPRREQTSRGALRGASDREKSSPWTQRFAYEDIKRVLERAMISSAVLA